MRDPDVSSVGDSRARPFDKERFLCIPGPAKRSQYAIEFVEEIRNTPDAFRDASLETFHRELIELQAIHEARIEAKEQRELIRSLSRRAISRIRTTIDAYRLEIDAV